MQFNEGQLRVIERIKEQAVTVAPDPIVVVGPGGSGKTTCVMEAVKYVVSNGGSVLLCAPTNKAVDVLYETAQKAGLGTYDQIGFSTLHAALGLVLLPTAETRRVSKVAPCTMPNYDLIVIDECSMLGKFVVENILQNEIEAWGLKVVFMGDEKQVFPVREGESLVFSLYEVQQLRKVERFAAESGIADITSKLRDSITREAPFTYAAPDGDGSSGVMSLRDRFFKEEVVEIFSDLSVDPLKDARVMAWRNATVASYNKRIRAGRYGKDAPAFVEGEMVLAARPVGKGMDSYAYTDQALRVIKVEENQDYEWSSDYPDDIYVVNKVTVEHPMTKQRRILNVVTDSGLFEFEQELNRRRRIALDDHTYWPKFYAFLDAFDSLNYPYCTTVHKSQGSTYDCAYVDVLDIQRNNRRAERLRLLYVACSRPRHKLIVNTPNIRA